MPSTDTRELEYVKAEIRPATRAYAQAAQDNDVHEMDRCFTSLAIRVAGMLEDAENAALERALLRSPAERGEGESFGTRLREARVACGLSLRDVASSLGVTPVRLGALERGVLVPGVEVGAPGHTDLMVTPESLDDLLSSPPAPVEGTREQPDMLDARIWTAILAAVHRARQSDQHDNSRIADDAMESLRPYIPALAALPVQGEPLRQSPASDSKYETGATAPVQGEREEGEEGS